MEKRKRKGFTLLELMIVVVILGVLALLAVPALLNAVQESRESVVQGNLSAAASSISSRLALNNTITVANVVTALNASGSNPVDDTQAAYVAGAACGAGQVSIEDAGGGSYVLRACDSAGAVTLTKTLTASTAATTSF